MTQNEKDLIFKDICSRLPYGVKAEKYTIRMDGEFVPQANVEIVTAEDIIAQNKCPGYIIKPYLFPISSMTEEQKEDMIKSSCGIGSDKNVFDWWNKNHFDYRGLIPMGLANDATGLNIYSDNLVMNNKNHKHMTIECYDCHEVINFTEDDVIENWYVKCPCCGEEISLLP